MNGQNVTFTDSCVQLAERLSIRLHSQVLTSTSPCSTRIRMMTSGISNAPGRNKLRKAEQAMAVPKILLAGKTDAKKPPGTWVTRYPQKKDESTALSIATLHLNLTGELPKVRL